jgi:hypothetical protein
MRRAGRSCTSAFAVVLLLVTARSAGVQAQSPAPAAAPAPDLCAASEGARDEVATSEVVRTNLEPSYLVYPIGLSGLDPLYFEVSIAPNFFVSRPSWPFAFVLAPKIVARMFREHSAPVKTPSYMPRAGFFLWFNDTLRGKEPAFYTSLTFNHHSNGQTGPFFLPDGSINHDDGDFATNYLELSLYATAFTQRYFGWSRLALEWHLNFGQSQDLLGRYGLKRLHLSSSVLNELPLHGTLAIELSAILDDFLHASDHAVVRALERFPISFRYQFMIPGIELGFYVGYYFGHDYYNIWFDRLINVFQIGISGAVSPSVLQAEKR